MGMKGAVRGSEMLISPLFPLPCQGHWFNCLHFSHGLLLEPLCQASPHFSDPDVILPLSFCWNDLLEAWG